MKRSVVQSQLALFELAQRESLPPPNPRVSLTPATPLTGPCELCRGARASVPDFSDACRLCKTGRELDEARVCLGCTKLLEAIALREVLADEREEADACRV